MKALETAASMNMRIADFWQLTPREFILTIAAYVERTKRENEDGITLAYMNAAWQRSKKMPDLKKLLGQEEKPKQQTAEQMLEIIKKINAANGGTTC